MVAIAEPRARDPKPTVSIVPHAHGTDLFFAYFPALRTGLLSSGPCPEADISLAVIHKLASLGLGRQPLRLLMHNCETDISFGAYGTDFL
jgi:hypothetical protein